MYTHIRIYYVQVKCDTDGETLNRRQTAADNDPTWLTLWDSRGRTYKYLSVNDDGDDDNNSDQLPLGRDSALVTLLLSLRLGSSRHVNGSGAANATAAEPTLALTNGIRGPDPSETTSARPRPTGATTTTTTTTTAKTARPPLVETTTVADVNDTAVTTPRKEIGSEDDAMKSASDPPANSTAGKPDSKDELLRAAGPRRDDDVRLKIVLTVRSPRRVSAAHDDDDGNDSTRGKSAIVDAEDYNYLVTDP